MALRSRVRIGADRAHVLAVILLVPALLMAFLAAGSGTFPGDVAAARAVQGVDIPGAELLAELGYILGGTAASVAAALLVALVLFMRSRALPSLLVVATPILFLANRGIKWLVASPRPTAEQVRVTEDASFYGFPSGHVMTAVIVYGVIFFLAPALSSRQVVQNIIRAAAITAIAITSFGRVYTGAHWPSDVGGGYLWGSVVLLLVVTAYGAARRRWSETPAGRRLRALDQDRGPSGPLHSNT